MNISPLGLALKIAQLVETHSEKELRAAVTLLRARGIGSSLLDFLAQKHSPTTATPSRTTSATTTRPLEETTSRAVLRRREVDPDKFRMLSEFDLMVRRGQILATHEDLRRFGERVSKDFQPRKARKETIGALMAVLADRPLQEIERLIEFAASFGVAGDTDDYQRLAQFLIKGKEMTRS